MSYTKIVQVALMLSLCSVLGLAQAAADPFLTPETTVSQWAISYGSGGLTGGVSPNPAGPGYYLEAVKSTASNGQDTLYGLLDSSGALTWAKEIDVATKDKDAFSITPTSTGFLVNGIQTIPTSPDENKVVWNKFGTAWNNVYGYSLSEPGAVESGSFHNTSDGGLLFTGSMATGFGTPLLCFDTLIFKTSATGPMLWKDVLGYGCVDNAGPMVEVSDGYLIAGILGNPVTKLRSIFLMKHSKGGPGILWTKTYSISNPLTLTEISTVGSLQQLSDGNFLIVGTLQKLNPLLGAGTAVLLKVSPAGAVLWQYSYGNPNLTVAGLTVSENPTDHTLLLSGPAIDLSTKNSCILVLKVSAAGLVLQQRMLGTGADNNLGFAGRSKYGDLHFSGVHSSSITSTNLKPIWGKLNSTTLVPSWTKSFSGTSSVALANENASKGFFLSGTTTSYGFASVKGDVFGMVLDSNGNYPNCHVSTMSLSTASPGVAGTAAGLTPGIATFKSVTAGNLAGYDLPVGTATVESLDICAPITTAAADAEED
ncbi:MAG: hypothetical protein ACLP6G_21900 [Terriglobales bacterium]